MMEKTKISRKQFVIYMIVAFGPAYIGIISMLTMIIMAVIICVKQRKIEC